MDTTPVSNQLAKVGRDLVRWRAQLRFTWCLAVALGVICVIGVVDLWLRLGRFDRFITWSVILAVAAIGIWIVRRALRKRYTEEGVAASIEKTFPELDNHLINYLQLARNPEGDALKAAYVKEGAPKWQSLDFTEMRDRVAHRRSRITLGSITAVVLLLGLVFGKAWGVALYRTVNPFSSIAPASLTRIVDVNPGDSTVLQGDPLVLTCTVNGFGGHEVRIDIDPSDSDKTTYSIGSIASDTEEEFSYRMKKVATGLRYRFRAGDSPPSEWFTVDTRPPPAFTGLQLAIKPPEYMNRPAQTIDPRDGAVSIPVGSEVTIMAASNTALSTVAVVAADGSKVPLATAGSATSWSGVVTVSSGSTLRLAALDTYDVSLDEEIGFILEPDRPPGIEIVAPSGRTILPPGQRPQIEFRVSDDFGLKEVLIEEVSLSDAGNEKPGKVRQRWVSESANLSLEELWKSETTAPQGRDIAFRIVARDNRPGEPNESVSSSIIFSAPSQSDIAEQRNELEQRAFAGLQQVVDLQRQNIDSTQRQLDAIGGTETHGWQICASRQLRIRELTKELLSNTLNPLGSLTPKVKALYVNEMVLAIDSLRAIPGASEKEKAKHATESLAMQNKILRQLASAQTSAAQAKIERRLSGITAMLESMIREQGLALKQTQAFVETKAEVSVVLVDAQDKLAEDLSAFEKACTDEAEAVRGNDSAFADTLVAIAGQVTEMKIRNDMVIAAERLDENKPTEAIPFEKRALANLKVLHGMLENVQLEQEEEKREAMLEAVEQAKEKIAKIKDLHAKMLEAMEGVRGAKDKNDELYDTMEEAYEEMLKNTKESLLEVPTDLHVFTDLNVANDIVEDVISVFQEIEQAEGTEDQTAADMVEQAYAKEDIMLEMMEEAEGKLDDMEMWLGETPDNIKVTTEAFDREEMPESGIATGALATEVEDMIGDLLEENEDLNEAADDGATTHAMPDMEMGWEVMEGDISSFAAKGKSGNETPDHKEQDGRSNVGRQGMSTGETAAGSGTISEGDKNIEERRTEDPTQSGQVDLDGEADTKATGGGKLATGKADDMGMSGGVERMDSNEAGSDEGMAALMARQADAIYAKASLKNVRVDSLKEAAHHLRQSADAIAKGEIQQLQEHRRIAVSALRRARAELEAGPSGAMDAEGSAGALDDVVESGPDQAPPKFRDQVAEYYKALNDAL